MYGIYTNIGGILMVNVTIYSSTMDPMGIPPMIARISFGIGMHGDFVGSKFHL